MPLPSLAILSAEFQQETTMIGGINRAMVHSPNTFESIDWKPGMGGEAFFFTGRGGAGKESKLD